MFGLSMAQMEIINNLDGWKYTIAPNLHDLHTNGATMVDLIGKGVVARIGYSRDRFELTEDGRSIASAQRALMNAIREAREKADGRSRARLEAGER